MKKIVAICLALLAASAGAVKIEWAQDVMQTTQTKVIVAYHGEDLRFWISPKKNGSDLSISGSTAQTWWQTKAMGDSWVQTNAVITTLTESGTTKFRFEIKWSGGSEGNADEVCFFVRWADGGDNPGQIDNPGVGDISYHINFIVKFLGSPGKNPTVVPLPRRTLDFATTQVLNPPYVTASDLSGVVWWEELYTWWDEEKSEILEEAAETAYQTVAEAANTNWLCTVAAANEKLAEAKSYTQELTSERAKLISNGSYKEFEGLESPLSIGYGLTVHDSWLTVENWKIRASDKTLDEHISEKIASATNATIAATKEIFILQGTNTQPRLEFTNRNTMNLNQTDPNGQFVKTLDWGGDGLGWQMTGLAVNINPAVYVMSVFDMETNGFSFAQGIVRNQTERESRPASTLKPDGSPVLTRNAADARFAPTNVAVAVAEKIDAADALGVFNANADYLLVNLADNAAAATLASGTIANLATSGNALNITLSLAANDRSADALLRIVNTQDVALGIGNQGVALDGAWPSTIKAGTNLVMFVKTAFKNGVSTITVTSKEVK